MNDQHTSVLPPIVKVVVVNATPDRAFHRFTAEMARWWPLASHSVGEADAETVAMEGYVGGRIVERIRGGRECVWGTITAWEPPQRLGFTWHPGHDPEQAQQVEVRFTPSDARTRVELRHWGFERLGEMGRRARRLYPMGWAYVLGLYAERRGIGMTSIKTLTSMLMALRRRRQQKMAQTVQSS